MPNVSGLVVPKMFPLIHSLGDVYTAQYAMNLFHELTKITQRFRRSRKVTFAALCSPHVHQEKKKHLRNVRKCLSVDQPGLEPGTSRL